MGNGVMTKGKIIRFDEIRGYGFIAPDGGGEDVFMHVNDLEFDKRLAGQGVLVEFLSEEGDRGLKASKVRLLARSSERIEPFVAREVQPNSPDDDSLCDVLSVKEFLEEVTECLLEAAPGVTAEQIVQIRQRMAQMAHSHGWVDT
jgi:cold shock protein